jgi:hypothetical protein
MPPMTIARSKSASFGARTYFIPVCVNSSYFITSKLFGIVENFKACSISFRELAGVGDRQTFVRRDLLTFVSSYWVLATTTSD